MKFNKTKLFALIMLLTSGAALANTSSAPSKTTMLQQNTRVALAASKVSVDGSPIETMEVNQKGELFVGTTLGSVFKYNDKKSEWQKLAGKLDGSNIYALYSNKNNDLYVGTRNGHIYVLKNGSKTLSNISYNLKDTGIWTIVGDKDDVYALTKDGIIYHYAKNKWVAYPKAKDTPYFYSIVIGENGDLYAGSSKGQVWHLHDKQWIEFGKPIDGNLPIWTLLNDGNTLFAGTETGEVYEYDNNKWSLLGNPDLTKIDGTRIWQLVTSQNHFNNVLYAISDAGKVYKYEFASDKWSLVPYSPQNGSAFSWSIITDDTGDLYIGTSNDGVFKLNVNPQKITRLGIKN
jgi:ligand-binding sensor domain-containing protein